MNRFVAIAVISLLAGFAAARWLPLDDAPSAEPPPRAFDETLPMDERIAALEQAVSQERQARQLLQEEVIYLNGELERLQAGSGEPAAADEDRDADVDRETQTARRRAQLARRSSRENRMARLVRAGFAEDRAAWIVRRESQLQMEALEARYDAQQSGNPQAWRAARGSLSETLRAELGETDYERYLDATGRPTSIGVSNVLDGSPAQRAGLEPGDEIVRYGGERVFSMSELSRVTYEGQPGETVTLEIVRNGTSMQVTMPRGPIGITGGGRFRR